MAEDHFFNLFNFGFIKLQDELNCKKAHFEKVIIGCIRIHHLTNYSLDEKWQLKHFLSREGNQA